MRVRYAVLYLYPNFTIVTGLRDKPEICDSVIQLTTAVLGEESLDRYTIVTVVEEE